MNSKRYSSEIVRLHDFFEEWFRGTVVNSATELARFADVLAPDFHIVTPSGVVFDKDSIVARVEAGHGADPTVSIEVRCIQVVRATDRCALCMYEEWQTRRHGSDTRRTVRVSSVSFGEYDAGLVWLHVHETWKALR